MGATAQGGSVSAVWVVVRPVNAGGDGTWGDSTLVPDPRDDLDATGPCP